MSQENESLLRSNGVSYVLPFILITSCFALWGFANDITNPMVKAFSKIFRMSVTDGALVQVAFYGGYFAMAFPAAVFIRKYSYKAGILLGLAAPHRAWKSESHNPPGHPSRTHNCPPPKVRSGWISGR